MYNNLKLGGADDNWKQLQDIINDSDDEFEMHFQDTKQLEKTFNDLEIEDLNRIDANNII